MLYVFLFLIFQKEDLKNQLQDAGYHGISSHEISGYGEATQDC